MTTTINLLGVELDVETPDTAEAYDLAAGAPGSCLEVAVNYDIYRSYAAKARAAIVKFLDSKGIKPGENEKLDLFAKRIVAEGLISSADYQTGAKAAVDAADLDFNALLKGSSRAAVGKEWTDAANATFAAWAAGKGTPEGTMSKIRAVLPNAVQPEDNTDVAAWGSLIREFKKAQSAVV